MAALEVRDGEADAALHLPGSEQHLAELAGIEFDGAGGPTREPEVADLDPVIDLDFAFVERDQRPLADGGIVVVEGGEASFPEFPFQIEKLDFPCQQRAHGGSVMAGSGQRGDGFRPLGGNALQRGVEILAGKGGLAVEGFELQLG